MRTHAPVLPVQGQAGPASADFQTVERIMQSLFPAGPVFLPAAILFRLHAEANSRGFRDLSQLLALLDDPAGRDSLKMRFLFGAYDLFRDPLFYAALRREILPLYAGRPLQVWFPFTGTGCELYSTLTVLAEERSFTFDSTLVHATDFNDAALREVSQGAVVPDTESMYRGNYKKSSGKATIDDYVQNPAAPRFNQAILSRVVFSSLDALSPLAPGRELFDVVVCRDMLAPLTEAWRTRWPGSACRT
jgi:chemotaxis protein methyltransferase CheR